MVEQPSGTVTLVFTDIEGSTRLLGELGRDTYRNALAEHRRVVRETCSRHAGYEVDCEGDSFFYAFASAAEAVAAVEEVMRELEGGLVRIRVGVHTGEPGLDPPKYVGMDVHRAARIMGAASGGQVLLSESTYGLVEVDARDLGLHRLKDMSVPQRLYQLGRAEFPPLKTISNTNLPRPASSFVGRKREVAEVVSLLRSDARLLTLTGPGGSGKTRLALEAAAELVPEFKEGVFWVGLAPLRDTALVSAKIARTLGANEGLADHIGDSELLLLLDNFEQVVEAAPELSALVEACPNLRLLSTSRELLRVRGEVEYPVPPLTEPEAIELFCARSGALPDLTVHSLCRALDYLPLALELAAARASVLSPKQILERLSGRLNLLKGGRGADPRHKTLRATIQWSYELLPEHERRLFGRLSVFVGGCTFEAAEQVAEADLDSLQALVDKSLLRRNDERFWMLETMAVFARERLEASGEAEELRRRLASYFLALAEETEQNASQSRSLFRIAALRSELDNFRSALAWLRLSGAGDLELRLAVSLFHLWIVDGYADEGQRAVQAALAGTARHPLDLQAKALKVAGDLALDHGDFASANELLERALSLFRELGLERSVASCLTDLGHVAKCERDDPRAEALFEQSIELARRLGDASILADALLNFGDFLVSVGDFARAEVTCTESLALSRQCDDALNVGACLFSLGLAHLHQNRHEDALVSFIESLKIFREHGYAVGIGYSFEGLAALAILRGHGREAARLLGAAEVLFENAGTALEPAERALHERTMVALRADLGDAVLKHFWEDGRMMTLDDAVEFALLFE